MDTHAAVVRLTETGMSEPQTTAIVSTVRLAVDDGVATKADAAALGTAIANLNTAMANLATKAELNTAMANLNTAIANQDARLTRLVLVSFGAIIAAMVALLKL